MPTKEGRKDYKTPWRVEMGADIKEVRGGNVKLELYEIEDPLGPFHTRRDTRIFFSFYVKLEHYFE